MKCFLFPELALKFPFCFFYDVEREEGVPNIERGWDCMAKMGSLTAAGEKTRQMPVCHCKYYRFLSFHASTFSFFSFFFLLISSTLGYPKI